MILITGATGFVGGRMLETFIQTFGNQQVVGTGRSPEMIVQWQSKGATIESGDLSDANFTKRLFEKYPFKTIIHAAAKSSPWGTYDSFYQSNVVATSNLLEAASTNKVERLIYISTPSIYLILRTDSMSRKTTRLTTSLSMPTLLQNTKRSF